MNLVRRSRRQLEFVRRTPYDRYGFREMGYNGYTSAGESAVPTEGPALVLAAT